MRQPPETAHTSPASLHDSQGSVQGFEPGRQRPEPLQVSAPSQYRPSLQGAPAAVKVQTSRASLQPVTQAVTGQRRAPVPVQIPPLQASVSVQNCPSLQAVPFVLDDQLTVLSEGWHDWHWLPGFVAPAR